MSQYGTKLATWGSRLPEPDAPFANEYVITEAEAIVAVSRSPDWQSPPPRQYHEAYLRLYTLDLEDEGAILRWLNAFGPLSMDEAKYGPLGFDWHAGFFRSVEPWLRDSQSKIVDEIAYWDEIAGPQQHYTFVQTLSSFIWQATSLRDLVRAWRWHREGVPVEADEWESPVWEEHDDRFPLPTARGEAAELVHQGIRNGLVPFHPELRIQRHSDDDRWHTTYGGGVGFYFICCLELYNHIAENAVLHMCANERCSNLFVHQDGGARHRQHRSLGVKYCSLGCARAQVQREYRRRKREVV